MGGGICTIDECVKVVLARGWCPMHYARWRTHGDPLYVASDEQRFWSKVDRSGGPDACWPWTESLRSGYGQFHMGGRAATPTLAHRFAYELVIGPIPEGLHLDHRCHNEDPDCPGGILCLHRRCCNPRHTAPTTCRENLLRGQTLAAANAAKTHCARGHAFEGDNVFFAGGQRKCRECTRRVARESYWRKRARLASV